MSHTVGDRIARPRVVVTRAADQSGPLVERLSRRGFDVVVVPTIRIEDPADGGEALRMALASVQRFRWLVVTSPNGAARVVDGLRTVTSDAAPPTALDVAAVGPGTAAVLEAAGIGVDLVPTQHTAEGLVTAFPEVATEEGAEVLIASADIARDVLPDGLRDKGWEVTVVDAYRNVAVPLTDDDVAELARCDVITFASGSAVRSIVAAVGRDRIPPIVVTIGPIASAAARQVGLAVAAEADPHTIDGLVDAVEVAVS